MLNVVHVLKETRKVVDELAGAASVGRRPGMYGPKEVTNILKPTRPPFKSGLLPFIEISAIIFYRP